MEAAGIEPASAAAPDRASTGIAHHLISPGRPVGEQPTAGPAILWSHPSGDWLSFGASPFMTPLPEPRAESGATRHLTRLGGECEISIRTYVVSRLFYEADRGPRPAAQPENRPRRDLVAPVCFVGHSVARSNHASSRTSCVPIRRQMMCVCPTRTGSPYSKVARPSGAHVIWKTPAALRTPLTRRPRRNRLPASRSSTKRPSACLNAWRCAFVSAA
jgi:hypothetical protein